MNKKHTPTLAGYDTVPKDYNGKIWIESQIVYLEDQIAQLKNQLLEISVDLKMNQTIKTLAIQAGFKYINDSNIGWAGNHNASLPLFADLIIEKCINIALDELVNEELIESQEYASERAYLNGNNGGVIDVIDAIKQYFGVEHE
jgi:hypothetical protein